MKTHSDGPGVDRQTGRLPTLRLAKPKYVIGIDLLIPEKPAVHAARWDRLGGTSHASPAGRSEGSSPCAAELPQQPCIRSIPAGSGAMMLSYASAAKLRAAGPFYSSGTRAMGGSGTPPPRIVIGNPAPASGTRAEPLFFLPAPSSQKAECRRTPAGTRPVVTSSHSAIKSLRASATIIVFLVVLRPSCVRCRNHWTSALSG